MLVATTVTLAHANFSSFPVCAGRAIVPSTQVAKIFATISVSLIAISFFTVNRTMIVQALRDKKKMIREVFQPITWCSDSRFG